MTQKELQNILSLVSPVSEDTAAQLFPLTDLVVFAKGELLEETGQRVRHQMVVVSGIVRLYLTDSKGQQHTTAFFSEGEAVSPAIIRSVGNISYVSIDVVSRSASVLLFRYGEMEQVMQGNKDLEMFGYRVLMQDAFRRAEREKILLTATGIEKLEWLRSHYPNLENEVPHYYIAQFLGLTPTSLSRVRKNSTR